MVAVSGPIVDRLPSGDALADADIETPDDRVLDRVGRRYLPPPPPLAEPVCLRDPGDECLLWTVADPSLRGAHVVLAGDRAVALPRPGQDLVAYRLADGEVAWTGPGDAPWVRQQLVTGDLLLTVDADGLSARSLTDGGERWRRADLNLPPQFDLHTARQVDDVLLLAGLVHDPERRIGYGNGEPSDEVTLEQSEAMLVALDAATGEDTWRAATVGPASIATDGTAVHLAADGRLTALAPDGSIRWAVEGIDPAIGGGVWVTGRYVNLWRGDGSGEQLHRLADGRPLGFGGMVLDSDGDDTLLEVWAGPSGPSDLEGHGPAYLLLDAEDREVWRTPADRSRCTTAARFETDTVRVFTCEQDELVLDRADGSLLDRTSTTDTRSSMPWRATTPGDRGAPHDRVGPFALHPERPDAADSAYVLIDTRDGGEVVRFPPEAFPLMREQHGPWTADLGGIAVIQHRGGLTAIALPPDVATAPRPFRRVAPAML